MQMESKINRWETGTFCLIQLEYQVDASQHGLSEEIAGNVISSYTMGESNLREGMTG